jgi:hypothetical protein
MNRITSIVLVVAMTVSISSTTFGGTIIGARTSRAGTIVGARAGNIPGARTGNIAGTSVVIPSGPTETRFGLGILITGHIHGLVRLFVETSLF